ncbi:MAG: DHHW family protein [Candidatus Gastranaerophilales bacterium]|nr:DHHW family protein [Candidatus Gastranaerophilales bacterium]
MKGLDEKKNAVITICFLAVILIVFMAADFVNGDRLYSDMENRLLAEKPVFEKEYFLSGEFGQDYENYVSDQFVSRDKWVEIKTRLDILFQKKDINGVYLGKDDYLIEQHLPDAYTVEMEQEKVAMLGQMAKEWDIRVMLIPTADNILTDKLPAYASYYDETGLLELVRETVGEDHYVDVYRILTEHQDEEIYYRTDHHWTSLGAYYGYCVWSQDKFIQYAYDVENMTVVSDDFQGTLHSRVPVVNTYDKITVFPELAEKTFSVTYDRNQTADSLFEEHYLDGKNQYGYFLDDNHGLVEIETNYRNGKTLFVVKDSYANSLIPMLTPYYQRIYVVDMRYYRGRLSELMEECEPEYGMDVLVVYNCIHFLEEFRY